MEHEYDDNNLRSTYLVCIMDYKHTSVSSKSVAQQINTEVIHRDPNYSPKALFYGKTELFFAARPEKCPIFFCILWEPAKKFPKKCFSVKICRQEHFSARVLFLGAAQNISAKHGALKYFLCIAVVTAYYL